MSSNVSRGTTKQQQQQQKDASTVVMKRCCDICQMRPKFKKMTFLTCKTCQVQVHRECYEGVGTNNTADHNDDDNDFECRACHAVGTSIKGRKRIANKKKYISKTLRQAQRPMECCLCSAPQGIHAMHPLFDHSGSKGRQIILPEDEHHGKPERLAWVHSLCAYSVCFSKRTAGCVYGCNRRGQFLDDDGIFTNDDPSADDDLSINSDLDHQYGQDDLVRIYHFAYCLPTMKGATNEWTKRIQILQQTLKCTICGLSDKSNNSFRIPLQCRANEETELSEFNKTHREMAPDETCTQALHVGCAMWGVDSNHPVHKRVFYYPGNQDVRFTEPVVEVYCDAHAMDIALRATQKTNANNNTQQTEPSPPTFRTLAEVAAAGGPPPERLLKGLKISKAPTPHRLPTEHAPTSKPAGDKPHPYAQLVRDGSSGAAKPGQQKKRQTSTGKANATRKPASAVTVGTALNPGHSPNTAPKKPVHVPEGGKKSTIRAPGTAPRAASLLDNVAKHSNKSAPPSGKSQDPNKLMMTTSIRRASSMPLSSSPMTSPTGERPVAAIPLNAPPLPPPYSRTSSLDSSARTGSIQQRSLLPLSGRSRKKQKPEALLEKDDAIALGRNHSKRGKKQKTAHVRQDDYYGSREPTLPVAEAYKDGATQDAQSSSLTLNRSNGDSTTLSNRPVVDAVTEDVPKRKRGRPRLDSREDANAPTHLAEEALPSQDIEAPHVGSDDHDGMTDVCDSPESDDVPPENAEPGRWDHLKAGPHYTGMFDFGEWDTYEKR